MRNHYTLLVLLAVMGMALPLGLSAEKGPGYGSPRPRTNQTIDFRSNCDNAVSQYDMEVNNVRARLTTGGDIWYDGANGRYIIPKPPPGIPEVSSIYAGAVWLGGVDPGGNLKVAAQDYGRNNGSFDYYPGPLTPEGTVEKDTCARWDKFFTVTGEDIRTFLGRYEEAKEMDNLPLNTDLIPASILGWPGFGNPYFADIHGFELPDADQGLAGFWDEDFSGDYDPTMGDYPIIEIRGCSEAPQFPSEMTFYVYNDAGNTHRQSNTPNQIQMEIQVQAFAYTSSDDFNNMTFQRYKLINRAQEDILNTYFAMWMDPDLGCSTDDYVGSDTVRSLAFVYNEDELDGETGCTCDGGVATYCDEVPILGVDYFRGPRGADDVELGMSSFMYYNRRGVGNPPPATTDPETADEYYNFLQGSWRDGTPLYSTGDGYDETSATTRYAFPSTPDDESNTAWSMCSADLEQGDRRTIQASGPFTLTPGAVNELIIGVVWVPDQTYPCPSLRRLQTADDLAQSLFNNCFARCEGPDAPDVDLVELDREIILQLSNPRRSNNFNEEYTEKGLGIPLGEDSLYRFEGYQVFQLIAPNVEISEVGDVNRIRQVAQFDLQNGVTRVFNWEGLVGEDVNPLDPDSYFVPELQVSGNDEGIRHTLRITTDAFAEGGDSRLINHRRYYYKVIAYGYNNYKVFDPFDQENPGQRTQYKRSSNNVGDQLAGGNAYTAIPRPTLDRELFAEYGEGAVITRLAGQGNNGNFLDLNEETVVEIEAAFAENDTTRVEKLTYEPGAGPITVFVANPRTIRDGEYEITFVDEDMDNDELDDMVGWTLRSLDDTSLPVITSEYNIDRNNEQIIPEYGFSVQIADVAEPGDEEVLRTTNGAIGATLTYEDRDGEQWLNFLPDNFVIRTGFPGFDANVYNYVATDGIGSDRLADDPEQALTNLFPGVYPLQLMEYLDKEGDQPYISPTWTEIRMGGAIRDMELSMLRNVDVVFTDDKSLWTRCPVVETSNRFFRSDFFEGQEIKQEYPLDPRHLDLRDAPSVTRNAGSDGLPEVDTDIDIDFERGYGWFPGYAVDVETGERLQVFWGENSLYDGRSYGEYTAPTNGNDMIWNPSSVVYSPLPDGRPHIYNYVSGGQHYFYVMDQVYDEGEFAYGRLEPSNNPGSTRKVRALRNVIWTGFPLLTPGASLKSYANGIIPNKATLKLRVNNAFEYAEGTEDTNGYPTYRFKFEGKSANTELDEVAVNRALDAINIVPNPYYGSSIYEDDAFQSFVKITNLPAQATVSIYTLDGKFIRRYDRDEREIMLNGSDRPVGTQQIAPAITWDLKNQVGIPVASGVYLIHVDAPGIGERTLKFFGVQTQFDPSGL